MYSIQEQIIMVGVWYFIFLPQHNKVLTNPNSWPWFVRRWIEAMTPGNQLIANVNIPRICKKWVAKSPVYPCRYSPLILLVYIRQEFYSKTLKIVTWLIHIFCWDIYKGYVIWSNMGNTCKIWDTNRMADSSQLIGIPYSTNAGSWYKR